MSRIYFDDSEEETTTCIIELLRQMYRRLYTLKIETYDKKVMEDYDVLFTSASFQFAFNLDIPIVRVESFEEWLDKKRLLRSSRRNCDSLEPPRRKYKQDLVYYYQKALSSDSAFSQFLSYYHVIEHFFESVYHEEIVTTVQSKISDPRFSIKNDTDIMGLVKLINNKIQIQKEQVTFNEKEALKLTLKKYVDIDNIVDSLNEMNKSLIEYYESSKVEFSGGETIPFSTKKDEKIIKNLTNRIYDTRNSIVHSKKNNKLRYVPFRDDVILAKEIPIMRLIAEEIIINTSEIL